MAAPRVSVIIPAYNPGDLLRRSLRSVTSQTFSDLEIVVVDDGGQDDLSWVPSFDRRITLIRQENRGVSIARNVGAAAAAGDLLAFLDQDDEWLPEKLMRQVAAIERAGGTPVVHTDFTWVLADRPSRSGAQIHPVTYHGLLSDQHVCLSSVLLSRDTFGAAGGFSPLFTYMQDYELFLRLAMLHPFVCVHEPLVLYHLHADNASRDYVIGAAERRELLRSHARLARRRGDDATLAAVRRGLARTRTLFGSQAYDALRESAHRRDPVAVAHFARAVAWSPGYAVRALTGKALQEMPASLGRLTKRLAPSEK